MKTPVVLDGRYVYAFTVYYSIAALWGLMAGSYGLYSIGATGGRVLESIWALTVGILSVVLFTFSIKAAPMDNYTDTIYARAEKHFTLGWIAVVFVLPVAVIWQFVIEADVERAASSVSAFLYLVFPTARWVYLILRAKKSNG